MKSRLHPSRALALVAFAVALSGCASAPAPDAARAAAARPPVALSAADARALDDRILALDPEKVGDRDCARPSRAARCRGSCCCTAASTGSTC